MRVGVLKVHLEITDSASLKDKRMVLKGLKDRIRERFNVSISEVDHHDKWQRSTLGVASVSHDKRFIDSVFNKVIDHIEKARSVIILDMEIEIL